MSQLQNRKKETYDMPVYKRAILTVVTVLGTFMAILDSTIVDVIIPKIISPMNTDMYGIQWVVTAYMLSAAVVILMVDHLIKTFGRKKVFLGGVIFFTVGSFLSGIAGNMSMMITFRSIQGIGEALILVTAQVMVFSYYPPKMKNIAMGIFVLGVAFAPAIGPVLGGYLADAFDWRMVFYINIPVGIFVLIVGSIFIPTDEDLTTPYYNIKSFIFLTIFTISFLILLSKGQQYGWLESSTIVYMLFIALIGFLLFIYAELVSSKQLFEYSLFLNREYVSAVMISFILTGFSMYQYFYLMPIFYEQVKGLTTMQAGMGVLGYGIFIGITSILGGVISEKYSPKYVLLVGVILYVAAVAYFIPPINYYTPYHEVILRTIPFGVSLGLFFAPLNTIILQNAGTKGEQAVMINDYIRYVGGSIGTAMATNDMEFFQKVSFQQMSELQNYEYVRLYIDEILQKFANIPYPQVVFGEYETFMSLNYGFHNVFTSAAVYGVVGALFVIFMFKKKDLPWVSKKQ